MKSKNILNGEEFINYMKKKYGKKTDTELAILLGQKVQTFTSWKKNGITLRIIYEILEKSKYAHTKALINPIVEFYPLNKTPSRKGVKYEIVDQRTTKIKDQLQSFGIYVFYDSRGKAVYVGKAKNQTLWDEMKSVYNRSRNKFQEIKKVSHLKKGGTGKNLKISKQQVQLHDIATYFSAYSVNDIFINNLEAAMIRMFPNDLLNGKTENFNRNK